MRMDDPGSPLRVLPDRLEAGIVEAHPEARAVGHALDRRVDALADERGDRAPHRALLGLEPRPARLLPTPPMQVDQHGDLRRVVLAQAGEGHAERPGDLRR